MGEVPTYYGDLFSSRLAPFTSIEIAMDRSHSVGLSLSFPIGLKVFSFKGRPRHFSDFISFRDLNGYVSSY